MDSRRVLITGTSRGLGLAMAEGIAAAGHTVFGCSRNTNSVAELRSSFPAPHDFQQVDVSNDQAVQEWAQHVMSQGGPPDLLINNAATINANAPLWEVPLEEFESVIDVGVKGAFHVIRHFVPTMVAHGKGVIVNFSSGWGRSTSADVAPYCASKWAIEGMTRALADELPQSMAAIPLNPGIINTEMLQSCFGEQAASFPDATTWGRTAVPFLLSLSPEDNGKPLTVPGC